MLNAHSKMFFYGLFVFLRYETEMEKRKNIAQTQISDLKIAQKRVIATYYISRQNIVI